MAVEEKSVIDYNRGNPDGVLDPGEEPAQPQGPAGRDLPEGGHALLATTRFFVLDAAWVERRARSRRRAVRATSSSSPTNQREVLEFGFRPGNPDGRRSATRSSPANGVDPNQPQTLLEVPAARRC